MKAVTYSALFTILAVGAVAAELLDAEPPLGARSNQLLDRSQPLADVPISIADYPFLPRSDQLLERSQPLTDDPISITDFPFLPRSNPIPVPQPRDRYPFLPRLNPISIAQPRARYPFLPRPNSVVQNSSIDRRLADLLQAQSQLRKELKKAQIQQSSQIQLIGDIDKLAESTAQFQDRLAKVREAQVQRLDRPSAQIPQIPQKPENRHISQVLSGQHKSGTVIVITP